jgi:hypothetical protein
MNLNFADQIPADYPDNARVWVYQANRSFTIDEALSIEGLLANFTRNWLSHGAPVKGFAKLLFGQFIVIFADETNVGVGGCSTDSSVRMVKNIELDFNVELFNRQLLAFLVHERVQLVPLDGIADAFRDGIVTEESLYFNNTVQTKNELLTNWIIPVKQSWISKKLPIRA